MAALAFGGRIGESKTYLTGGEGGPSPEITLSTSTLTPSAFVGDDATSDSFTVDNTGLGILEYAITDDVAWLACSPTSGTSTGEADTITVTYTTSALSIGTYNATITVADPDASNNPQTIAVTLTISDSEVIPD